MGTIEVTPGSTFCPGATRALRIAQGTLSGREGPVFSFGPLIHNRREVSWLSSLGLHVIDPDSDDLPDLQGMPVVLRAHGIDESSERSLLERGAVLVDSTCPTVAEAQDIVIEMVKDGRQVLLLGSPRHPEVKAIVGRAPGGITVLASEEQARDALDGGVIQSDRVGIACQTTIRQEFLDSVVGMLRGRRDLLVKDTICAHVMNHRREAVNLCERAQVMIVIGGSDSSNTRNLAGVCEQTGVETHLIESGKEIRPEWIEGVSLAGVTGGSSTPDWQIEEVVTRLKELGMQGGDRD